MIPTQDALPEGGLGNVIALPLQANGLKSGETVLLFSMKIGTHKEDQLNVNVYQVTDQTGR